MMETSHVKWSLKPNSAYFKALSPYVQKRITAERAIARCVIKAAIAKGYYVGICNGEDDETPITRGQSLNWLVDFLHQCDEDLLVIRGLEPGKNGKGYKVGTVTLIYGNGGYDVLSDWSWVETTERNTEAVMNEICGAADTTAKAWENKLARN